MLDLQGELRIDHVTFRYSEDGPLILQDVSLHARPGEFIALVGESGSGKSTLLRLALGLESPLSGAVHYDGHDLERLNRQAVRNGVGMVVQDASLRPADGAGQHHRNGRRPDRGRRLAGRALGLGGPRH